jgi:hypothetical protein
MKRQRAARLCLLLLALTVWLSGCSAFRQGEAVVSDKTPEIYAGALRVILPGTQVIRSAAVPFDALRAGSAVWTSDSVAVPAMEAGAAKYWYPLVSSTMVIAVDRGAGAAKISGWRDLENAGLTVGVPREMDDRLVMAAMSFGLEGEDYTLGSTGRLLSSLAGRGLLRLNSSDAQALLCSDDYAAALCAAGRDFEIIVPKEGTFTYELGLLCRDPLALPENAGQRLLAQGFRLDDGRCGSEAYPAAEAYAPAAAPDDFRHLSSVCEGVTAMLLRHVFHRRIFSSANQVEHILFATIFCMITVAWVSVTMRRAMQESVRRGAMHTALLLVGWTLVRLVKYQLPDSPVLTSYLWYAFYFFMLSLPLVMLRIALETDAGGGTGSLPAWFSAVEAANAALFLLTFTNNFHHLVFRFDFSDPFWSDRYTYTAAYYVIYAAIAAELSAAMEMLLAKSRRSPRKAAPAMPILVFALYVAYSVGYFLRVPIAVDSDFTVVSGLLTVLFFEALIQAGLVPVNSMYVFFFRSSTLNLQIVDNSGKPVLSAGPPPTPERMARLAAGQSPIPGDGDTMLYADRITGGLAVWQEDLSVLNALGAQLQETQRRLCQTNAILAREEAAGKRLMTAEEHEALFARLEQETRDLTAKLSGMIRELPEQGSHRLEAARINLLLCCIKRRCNLFFIGRSADRMPAVDLMVYLDELADFAQYAGVRAVTTFDLSSNVPLKQAALLYGLFYELLSWASAAGIASLAERLSENETSYYLGVFPARGAADFVPGRASSALAAELGAEYRVIGLDGGDAIRLTVPKGGDGGD